MASVRSRTKIQRLGIPFTQPTPTYCAKRKSMMTNQQRSIASRSGSFSESNCFERPHHESDSHDHLLEPLSERVMVPDQNTATGYPLHSADPYILCKKEKHDD